MNFSEYTDTDLPASHTRRGLVEHTIHEFAEYTEQGSADPSRHESAGYNEHESIEHTGHHHGASVLSGFDLKVIACISMVSDHAAKFFHLRGAAELIFSSIVGRIAFPLFCFLLTEGYFHTHDVKKYTARVLLFALLAEIPFNLMCGSWFFPEHQNTMFTLGLGLIMFQLISAVREHAFAPLPSAFLQTAVIAGCSLASYALHLDYEWMGILCLACFYYFNGVMMKKKTDACFWGCLMLNLNLFDDVGAFLAMIPVALYNGSRGRQLTSAHGHAAVAKYAFYVFYPAHLLLLALIARLLCV